MQTAISGLHVEIRENFKFPGFGGPPSELARVGRITIVLRERDDGLWIDVGFFRVRVPQKTRKSVLETLEKVLEGIERNAANLGLSSS